MNIELDNVSKNFKNQTVLENVNLKLESGKIYGLVGRNGSGKSVLLKIMTGLMEPSDGIIKYGGIPLKKGQYAKDVGIVLDCIASCRSILQRKIYFYWQKLIRKQEKKESMKFSNRWALSRIPKRFIVSSL